MHLFYTPDLSSNLYTLNEIESKHCIKVLRLNTNDEIQLIDGKGGFYSAKIIDSNPKKCIVEITDTKKEFGKRNHYLHIAIAPTKNIDRFEWFLEKATEIGIDEITPIICEHSERKSIKPERLEKIIISAVKQSIKAYKPKLNNLTTYNDFINQNTDCKKYIAHCEENKKFQLKNIYNKDENALILIGPEGDFSTEEIVQAKQNAFYEISLGESRLRTETAGMVACHTINLINN
ncbi:MAG: 16S rRNA (uracil(1498)-N(3))-methyltransferase [Bacteroidales bacterium]|jgi:16S rRNA (uracil1498-N3)-methyltransferase|nr:16S rRNA (uracil(1498)-N(3))-methyltransferase [Bacteroidales bacterium]